MDQMQATMGGTSDNGNNAQQSVGGGGSLEAQYRQWEKRAESDYNSLTLLGTRIKKDGKDVGGTTGQSMSSTNFTSMKKSLREAQKEMERIRKKAAKQGIIIPKSEYETIPVNF